MLLSTVVLPKLFEADHFDNPIHHLNMEALLRGVDANGLILVDAEECLYNQICDNVELLNDHPKGQITKALFEELLKKNRQKIIRIVKTVCTFNLNRKLSDIAARVAITCKADSLLTDPDTRLQLAAANDGSVQVIPITEYTNSEVEAERKKREKPPGLAQMTAVQFDKLIAGATKYSRWLRFFDKQIGKGTGVSRFRQGMERIVQVWINAAHFPKSELSIEVYTVVDESYRRAMDPPVAYHEVKTKLVDLLQRQFDIPVKLSVKRDDKNKKLCHDRFLQTQSLSIMFSKGFDIIENSGAFSHTFMNVGDYTYHLDLYRKLPEYLPPIAK